MGINFHSLAFKQSILILIGVSIVFAAFYALLNHQIQSQMTQVLTQKGEEISQANMLIIDKVFQNVKVNGDEIAKIISENDFSTEELEVFLHDNLKKLNLNIPQVVAIVTAFDSAFSPTKESEFARTAQFKNKEIVITTGDDYKDKEWFFKTKQLGYGNWIEPFMGILVKMPIAVYSAPVFKKDSNGNKVFAGVLCIDMSIAFIKETVDSIPIANSGYGVILSPQNTVVAHPNEDFVFKKDWNTIAKNNISDFEKLLKEIKSGIFVGKSLDGKESVIYFTNMKASGWTFMIVWPAQEYLEAKNSLSTVFWSLGIAGYAIMFILILVISLRVSGPLKKLTLAADKLGRGNFDVAIPKLKGTDELSHFAWAFSNMSSSLKNYINKQKNLDRIEQELNLARNIQMSSLPVNEEEEKTKDPRHELFSFLLPAKEVGGDFYDFFKLDDDHLCIVIADVSGKGVPAALFMMISKIILKTTAQSKKNVSEIFEIVNNELAHRNKMDLFVTVWMGILDLKTGHIEFASAGHNPPMIYHEDGTCEFVKSKSGLVLAAMEDVPYKNQSCTLKPGDTILLYTDGVTEATNSNSELYGDNRLLKVLSGKKNQDPSRICEIVKESLDNFVGSAEQFDDITMLVLHYLGNE